jgi:hypothetical protein
VAADASIRDCGDLAVLSHSRMRLLQMVPGEARPFPPSLFVSVLSIEILVAVNWIVPTHLAAQIRNQ